MIASGPQEKMLCSRAMLKPFPGSRFYGDSGIAVTVPLIGLVAADAAATEDDVIKLHVPGTLLIKLKFSRFLSLRARGRA